MQTVRILDCTLRDGGRVIDCAFPDEQVRDISQRLTDLHMDIIELGFLRDPAKVTYAHGSTFFTRVEQLRPFVDHSQTRTQYVAFVDYNLYDFSTLTPHDGTSVDGLRVGFTKKDLEQDRDGVVAALQRVKTLGYELFVQGVNSLGYTDKELLEIVEFVNEVHPYSFGIVDTYGAMYVEDVRHLFALIDHNMAPDIAIDFHSHNNFQLSFAFAQEVIRMAQGQRTLVLDATLDGMGKCAGNLNTELIVDYLVRKKHYDYDFDALLDVIDEHIYNIKAQHPWGYSIPAMMAGIYRSHPNNIIYLSEKMRLSTRDIKYMVSKIDPELRQRYDYDNIQKLYREYNHTKVNDRETVVTLGQRLAGRPVLLLFPGKNLTACAGTIDDYIQRENPVLISVNFVTERGKPESRYAFFGSPRRYRKFASQRQGEQCILVSNMQSDCPEDWLVNYESLIDRASGIGGEDFDNTAILLLNLLRRAGVKKMSVAGFDGFAHTGDNYYDGGAHFDKDRFAGRYDIINENLTEMLREYAKGLDRPEDFHFLTPSLYAPVFGQGE